MTASSPSHSRSRSSNTRGFCPSSLHSAAGMAGERTKLTVTARERLGTARDEAPPPRGAHPRRAVRARQARRVLRRRARAQARAHRRCRPAFDPRRRDRRWREVARVDPQGVPGRQAARGTITHIDLHEVRLDRPITAAVSVHLMGGENAPGVKEGGVLSQPLREISVEALPLEVPEHIDLDVSNMGIGDTLRIADVHVPEGVTLLDDPETVVATVTAPMRADRGGGAGGRGRRGRGRRGRDARRGSARGAGGRGRRRLDRRGVTDPPRRGLGQPGPRVRAEPAQRRRTWSSTSSCAGTAARGGRSSRASSRRSASTSRASRC